MSSMSAVLSLSSFNLLFFTQVLTVLTSAIKYNEYVTDKGKNISIPCIADGNIVWIKDNGNSSAILQAGKFLVFKNITTSDRGLYICFASMSQRSNTTKAISLTKESSINLTEITNNSTLSVITSTSPVQTLTDLSKNPNSTTATSNTKEDIIIEEYRAVQKINLTVRTPPGPVTQLYFKASTILGYLIWRFDKKKSGGYPLKSFTAETRKLSPVELPYSNITIVNEWVLIDPKNIPPNVRQMEIYRLQPNTTYEFRIWGNNVLGKGEIVTTNVTTLPEYSEEDLIRLIQTDLDNFDPRVWIVAVSIVLGTFVILAIGLCIVLSKECYQSSEMAYDDGWDSIKLIPNIILNPGFSEADGMNGVPPFTRTVVFDDGDSYTSEESDHEPAMEKFKRKVSVFFTGPTIKRI